jgi:hypothetical protein
MMSVDLFSLSLMQQKNKLDSLWVRVGTYPFSGTLRKVLHTDRPPYTLFASVRQEGKN